MKKDERERLITILKNDFNFDVVKEMIDLYHKIKRSRIPHKEKYQFEFKILSKVWEFALPKLKVEERPHDEGQKILFNIMVGSPEDKPQLTGKSPNAVQIPTKVDKSGSHLIQIPDNS